MGFHCRVTFDVPLFLAYVINGRILHRLGGGTPQFMFWGEGDLEMLQASNCSMISLVLPVMSA